MQHSKNPNFVRGQVVEDDDAEPAQRPATKTKGVQRSILRYREFLGDFRVLVDELEELFDSAKKLVAASKAPSERK